MYYLLAVAFIITGLNVILLIGLLYPAARNFYKTGSSLAGALLLFVALFLLENIMAIYFHATNMELYSPSIDLELAALAIVQMVSFGALLWVSYR